MLTLDGYYTQRDGDRPLRTLFKSPRVRTLRRLNLGQGIGEEGVIAVAESPHLTGLEWLWVASAELTNAAANAILASAALQNLRGGSFVSYHLSDAVRRRLKKRFPGAAM